MRLLDTILEIAFPSRCIICEKRGSELCLSCLISSPSAERESASWIFPIYDYRHPPIKKSLWFLKYKGRRMLARVFAETLYENILEELSELSPLQNFTDPLLVPIPLSPKRRRERGFNQAELLCEELVKIDAGRRLSSEPPTFRIGRNILTKPRETEHQARIKDRSLRLKNISGSFSVKDAHLARGQNVILIDDILTTGATLSEARRMLRGAGARKVIAFTIAH